MPPAEGKKSSALLRLRRAGTDPFNQIVKVGSSADFRSAMIRMIFRNIHLAFISRNEVVELNATENSYAPEQRDGEAPVIQKVRVAVKPDSSRDNANKNYWVEEVNFETSAKFKSLSSSRSSKKPAFELKEVPYDEWRKHYAKDKYGKYRGTEAPAEDTILIPEDEAKWRSPPVQIEPSRLIEYEEASPVIEPVQRSATFPEYRDIDSEVPLQTEQGSGSQPEPEQAIFVDDTGHTASRIVQEMKIRPTSPSSPAAPIFLSPPMSPIR